MTDQPNIILIMTDNQPADLLGCYGNHEIYTPNLDLMGKNGIRFNNAYCPNAMCSPSRASVWTGRMPCQHGVHTWLDDRLMDKWPDKWNAVEEFDTLPEILRRNGYATAMIGKYHLGRLEEPQNGIDHWITMARGHTLDFYGNVMNINGNTFVHSGHSVDFFTEKAIEYIKIRAENKNEPFFLLLPYNGPYGHWPSIKGRPGNRFAERYDDTPMHTVPREGVSKEAIQCYELNKEYHSKGKGGPDFSALLQIPNDLTSLRNYYSQMSMIDDGVGQIFETLRKVRLGKNTVVIFTADHGFSLGHHGFWGHAQATWPSNAFRIAYNIPLLFWAPEMILPGRTSERFVSSLDLFSTILGYLDLTEKTELDCVPSRDFSKILRNETTEWTDEIFIEQEETRAIRTPLWSYSKRFKESKAYTLEDELYDLRNDPDERMNVANLEDVGDIQQTLSAKIDEFFAFYADPLFDIWKGGSVKSNTSRPWLWKDAWGPEWHPVT